jgi:hypothetical protein
MWEDNVKMNFKDTGCEDWTGFNWLRIGAASGSCE